MPTLNSKLANKAFGEQAENELIVAYKSHQDALAFLSSALDHANGIALLQGPKGSGKSTLAKEQRGWCAQNSAVALVEGNNLTPRRLVTGMLSQYGVETLAQHDEQLLQLLNKFLTQEARSATAAVLIVDNAHRATSSTLRLLNWLAALDVRGNYALRIVLTGNERLLTSLRDDSMRSLLRRNPAAYSLNPLAERETVIYLRSRLVAAGGEDSEKVFPIDVCQKLHELSSGWPGPLNGRAIEALDRMQELHSARSVPRIIVTRDGEVVAEHELTEKHYIIGRTGLADIVIGDRFVSKIHAMLQIYSNVVVLFDLNSTNGTTVNSRIVEKSVLRSNDIISLGRYRLKVENAPAISSDMDARIKASDTVTIQTISDVRRMRAQRTVRALKNK